MNRPDVPEVVALMSTARSRRDQRPATPIHDRVTERLLEDPAGESGMLRDVPEGTGEAAAA